MNKFSSVLTTSRRTGWSLALAAMLGVFGAAGSATVHAQATAGSLFGKAPAGSVISIHNMTSGNKREIHVDGTGRYAFRALPVGIYSVTLEENGQATVQHPKVPVVVGRGIEVDFPCAQAQCEADTAKQ